MSVLLPVNSNNIDTTANNSVLTTTAARVHLMLTICGSGDPVLLRMCKVFQDGGHANRNRHYILILWRKYEEFFVVLLSFLPNAIYFINYIHSVVTLFKEIHVQLTINRLLTFKTFLQQNYCENINQNNDQYSRSPIKRPLSCTIIISIC